MKTKLSRQLNRPTAKVLLKLSLSGIIGGILLSSAATIASADKAFKLPAYQFLRAKEDWSVLKNANAAQRDADFWNKIKYVQFKGDNWASFGGHARWRGEDWRNFSFNENNDDLFHLWNVMLHGDIHLGDRFRAYIEAKSALSSTRDLPGAKRTLDVDTLALQQAFFDLNYDLTNDTSLTVRPGRQMLSFGSQRLVSPLSWSNTYRTWNGISAIVKNPHWQATAFATRYVPVVSYDTNQADDNNKFNGVYATTNITPIDMGLALYFFDHRRDNITINGNTGDEQRQTIGTRFSGQINHTAAYYEGEGAYQYGDLGNKNIRAYMLTAKVGYQFNNITMTPNVFVAYDYASGGSSDDKKVKTFSQLFPLGHAYLGWIDSVGRQNIRDFNAGISAKPREDMKLALQHHQFRRANTQDALYGMDGTETRAGTAGTSPKVGHETDMLIKYNFNRHIRGLAGYSIFSPDDFIKQSGNSKTIKFAYLQLQYTV